MLDLWARIKHDAGMAFNSLSLIIDVTDAGKAGIYSDFLSRIPANPPLFVRNDGVPVTLRFVQPSVSSSRPWDDLDLSTYTVALALGEFDETPTSGTFTLTFGANTTSPIPFSALASDVQTYLNALTSITSAGGVTVSAEGNGAFLVQFVAVGSRATITSDASGLNPTTSVVISEVVPGSGSVQEEQLVQLVVNPYALTDTWTTLPVAGAVVATVAAGSGSTRNVQSIALAPVPYGGTFQLTTDLLTTAAISYNATATQVQTALNADGATYTVSGNTGGPWTITSGVNGSLSAYTVNVSGLLVPVGLSGVLRLSTFAMAQRFLSSPSSSIPLRFECQVTPPGGDDDTVLQLSVNVNKDVINFSNLIPSPTASFPTTTQMNTAIAAAQALDLKIASNLSDLASAGTARTNLGLGTVAVLAVDTDASLSADSDVRVPSQKAAKTYIDGIVLTGIPPWSVQTANYTAVAGDRIQTTGGGFTITLPATPNVGDSVRIEDGNLSWTGNPITLARNGSKINNGTSNYSGDLDGSKLNCVYISLGFGWSIN